MKKNISNNHSIMKRSLSNNPSIMKKDHNNNSHQRWSLNIRKAFRMHLNITKWETHYLIRANLMTPCKTTIKL